MRDFFGTVGWVCGLLLILGLIYVLIEGPVGALNKVGEIVPAARTAFS